MRATDEIFEPARFEGVNFIPYSSPIEYWMGKDNKIEYIEFDKNMPINNDPDALKYTKTNQHYKMKVDYVV